VEGDGKVRGKEGRGQQRKEGERTPVCMFKFSSEQPMDDGKTIPTTYSMAGTQMTIKFCKCYHP